MTHSLPRVFPLLFLLAILCVESPGESPITTPAFIVRGPTALALANERFDLADAADLERLRSRSEKIIEAWKKERDRLEQRHERAHQASSCANLPESELRELLCEGPQLGKDVRGLKEMVRLMRLLEDETAEPSRKVLQHQLMEIAVALANNHRPSAPAYLGFPQVPFLLADALRNPVAKGHTVASNILLPEGESTDLGLIDPPSSSYWRPRPEISSADLYAGFDRADIPLYATQIWTYAAPKKAGWNPGFELNSAGQRIKAKFAETHSEPFTSRIFHALGYNVDPTDFVPELKIKYDRRLLREFNLRKDIPMKVGLFFIPLYTFNFQQQYDPFSFIQHAVLRDGKVVPGAELKQFLLYRSAGKVPSLEPENFNANREALIDFLVTTAANVQPDEKGMHSIGPWGFEGLGREHLRELRGAGVLAAWLGWWDSRFENTRLRIRKSERGKELLHYFSDLGVALGRSRGTFGNSSEKPNDFPWHFTQGKFVNRRGTREWQFKIVNYQPIQDTPAFEQITLDDARWMARRIGALSEQQIASALVAAGFHSAEVRIYTEKLLERRDQLVRDVGLEKEIPLFRTSPIRSLSYDPFKDGPVRISRPDRPAVQAPRGSLVVRDGRVELRKTALPREAHATRTGPPRPEQL